VTPPIPIDRVHAFVEPPSVLAVGASDGPLAGLRLAVKDMIDVAGTVTGAGNPTFAASRPPALRHATAVARLVAAGATVIGKTITDEFAYSLSGTNAHFGTPTNVAAPGRTPGGSSAGAAAAVAAGLTDLALGTDTGGSIRVPASYCAIFGWRPTHGAVPVDGVLPLAPSFDTVGLLAADGDLLRRGAHVVLGDAADSAPPIVSLSMVEEAFGLVDVAVATALRAAAAALAAATGLPLTTRPIGVDLTAAGAAFRARQGMEVWRSDGPWVETHWSSLGPGIRARFETAQAVTAAQVEQADTVRAEVGGRVEAATAGGTALIVPASSGPAPAPGMDPDAYAAVRLDTLCLTALAGLAGAPVVALPLAHVDGSPLGLAVIGGPGSDRALLDAAARVALNNRPTTTAP
jgi:amidase